MLPHFSGWATVIKADSAAPCVYYLPLFKIPSKVAKSLEKFQRDFFWDVDEGTKLYYPCPKGDWVLLTLWKEIGPSKEKYGGDAEMRRRLCGEK